VCILPVSTIFLHSPLTHCSVDILVVLVAIIVKYIDEMMRGMCEIIL